LTEEKHLQSTTQQSVLHQVVPFSIADLVPFSAAEVVPFSIAVSSRFFAATIELNLVRWLTKYGRSQERRDHPPTKKHA